MPEHEPSTQREPAIAPTRKRREPPTYPELMAERVRLRRQVTALKGGNAWLEKAAEIAADMTMRGPGIVDAIHHARRHFLADRYHDVPLCDIERSLHRQGVGSFVIVLVYEMVKPAIERQLDAMMVEMRDDPAAAERYRKEPSLIYGTPSCWPGRGAGRP